MVDVNATRLCVVCGVMFVRQHKRVYCSDACANTRQRQQSRASHVRLGLIKGDQTHKCKHCSVEFVGCANKVYCTQRCKDRARPAPKQPRKRSRNDAQRARECELRKERKLRGYDRSAEFEKAKQKRRTLSELRQPAIEAARIAKEIDEAHEIALRIDAKRDASIAAKNAKAAAKRAKMPSQALLNLRSNLVKYADYLTKSRAKGFKKKTGKEMPDDGTVSAVVMFGKSNCLYCNCSLDWSNRTHDHMIPLIKGGVHSACNVAPACKRCNDRKGSKDFVAWVVSLKVEHRLRAIKFFEERNRSILQIGLKLAA